MPPGPASAVWETAAIDVIIKDVAAKLTIFIVKPLKMSLGLC